MLACVYRAPGAFDHARKGNVWGTHACGSFHYFLLLRLAEPHSPLQPALLTHNKLNIGCVIFHAPYLCHALRLLNLWAAKADKPEMNFQAGGMGVQQS